MFELIFTAFIVSEILALVIYGIIDVRRPAKKIEWVENITCGFIYFFVTIVVTVTTLKILSYFDLITITVK
jgi:hypothetical protein